MKTLVFVLPELIIELSALLEAKGRSELSTRLGAATIERCSYDPEPEAGYIGLGAPAPSLHFAGLSTPVAETLSFYVEHGLNLDISDDGDLLGIEFIGRNDV